MYYDIIILAIGIIITIMAIYLIKRNNENNGDLHHELPINSDIDLKHYIENSEKRILENIDYMNEEIREMNNQIKEMQQLIYVQRQEKNVINKEVAEEKTFNHLLNYNKFITKNQNIIDLFHQNNTPEEIAKRLNKSVREVEMVVRLIK